MAQLKLTALKCLLGQGLLMMVACQTELPVTNITPQADGGGSPITVTKNDGGATVADSHIQVPDTGPLPDIGAQEFIVHEWGTFTSVQSSLGKTLNGLQLGDEPLPKFVYKRGLIGYGADEVMLPMVTQRMETPVIYFYRKAATKVEVQVDFPKGIITEWYPNAASWLPGDGMALNFPHPKDGQMIWRGTLAGNVEGPAVPSDDIWAPSRQVDGVQGFQNETGEKEKFIFYRGIGHFDAGILVKSTNALAQITNRSGEDIVAGVVLRTDGAKGAVSLINATLKPDETREIQLPTTLLSQQDYIKEARNAVYASLMKTGLYSQEAWALVNTWTRSYFQTPGLRVLYVVPRKSTDELLPLKVTPQPTETVRVLVGRVEFLTPEVESAMEKYVRNGYAANKDIAEQLQTDRFGLAKLWRVADILSEAGDKDEYEYCLKQIDLLRTLERQRMYQQAGAP